MKLTPANSTRTSASPSPGKPPAAFSTERTSGPPNLDTLTTRTCSHPFLPLIAPTPQTLRSELPTQVRTTMRRQAPPVGKHKPQPPGASTRRRSAGYYLGRVASRSAFPHHRIRIVLGPGGLQLYDEFHCIIHQHAPGLQGTVPHQTKVLAIQLRLGLKTNAIISPRIREAAVEAGIELDLPGNFLDGEISHYCQPLPIRILYPLASEYHFRVVLGIKEIRRPKVRVPVRFPGLDALRLDPRLNLRSP